jgi:homospermidine synthase
MDYRRVLDIADPYLGDIVGKYSDWTPLQERGWLYDEDGDVDRSDPWQFKNFRVV